MVAVTRVVLIIEYDGRCYHGSQLQAGPATIQGEIERAVRGLTGERCRIATASRTDAGVHARGQVVIFRTDSLLPEQTLVKGINYYLPRDIAVKA
ncbi:MAG: tRNA pseudouridine(38-40) synthase TruA, partial [Dehalococcoidales bacterium]|nr:tRNA pseudouridine(38-40) synthase TruA [Dehalococcoidales bacterium]